MDVCKKHIHPCEVCREPCCVDCVVDLEKQSMCSACASYASQVDWPVIRSVEGAWGVTSIEGAWGVNTLLKALFKLKKNSLIWCLALTSRIEDCEDLSGTTITHTNTLNSTWVREPILNKDIFPSSLKN
jgi:hypothetical protein